MRLYETIGEVTNVADIKMYENDYPEWSIDFFDAGGLEYNEELDAYKVEDICYCIEQAQDWRNFRGDFYNDGFEMCDANRLVFITVDESVRYKTV